MTKKWGKLRNRKWHCQEKFKIKMASSSPTKDARNAVLVKLDIDNLEYLLHSKYSLTILRVQLVNVLII